MLLWDVQSFVTRRYSLWMNRFPTWMLNFVYRCVSRFPRLHQRLGTTIIYVTHDQTEAMTLGTRIVVMNAGIVQQVDTPQNLYNTPCNLFVAGFIGSPQMNFIDATCKVKGDKVWFVAGPSEIELPPAKARGLLKAATTERR